MSTEVFTFHRPKRVETCSLINAFYPVERLLQTISSATFEGVTKHYKKLFYSLFRTITSFSMVFLVLNINLVDINSFHLKYAK